MEIEEPSEVGFTLYSRSGCTNCAKVKDLFNKHKFIFKCVNCDEYIIEDKDRFLSFIKERANTECRMFPIVFFDAKFLGGYNETKNMIDRLFLSFEEPLSF
jgi:glutaredoxin